MLSDAPPDDLAERDRDGVADHPAHRLEVDLRSLGEERVRLREALQDGSLAEGDRAVLGGVPEATAPEPVELCRERRCRFVLDHAAVDGGVRLPGRLPVARGPQVFRPVTPRATLLRDANPLQVDLRQARRSVERVALRRAPGRDHFEITDRFLHRHGLRVGRRHQLDLAEAGREQDLAPSALGEAVLGAVHRTLPDLVLELSELRHEVGIDLVLRHGRHVLHRHDLRHSALDQARELVQQRPSGVGGGVLFLLALVVPLGVRREGLARRAAGQDSDLGVAEVSRQLIRGRIVHVLDVEDGALVVLLIGVLARLINVDPGDDRDALADQAVGEPSCSTEQIDTGQLSYHSSLFGSLRTRSYGRAPCWRSREP